MTNRNLRSLVLSIALSGFIWTLVFSISSFQEIGTDNSQQQKKLANLSIVLGTLYVVAAAIFLFGVFAAASRRLGLIRIFSFLAVGAAVIVIASGFLRTIVHFILKNSLISECTALATGQNVVTVWGVWNSGPDHRLSPTEANNFCKNAWNHDSFSEIFWLLAEIILLPLFTLAVFGYARQESGSVQGRGRSIPTTYTPAYAAGAESNVGLPEVNYDQPRYAPPDSPPPFDKSLPGYGAGEMDKKDSESMRTVVEDDPFADYDELPRLK
jgi:hypothetical protein